MAGEASISEALARIEHKQDLLLDLILRLVPSASGSYVLTPVGQPGHICPVCTQPVTHIVNFMEKTVIRRCECKTGMTPPMDLTPFAPPPIEPKKPQDNQTAWKENQDELAKRNR